MILPSIGRLVKRGYSYQQGLCVSGGRGRGKDQRECRGGVLGVLAQAGGDLLDACPAEEADGGVAQEGCHRRPLPFVQGALVLPQRDILDALQPVLDRRVPACGCAAFEREQALRGPSAGERLVIP